ncbi:MAG: CoA pyrophosphatase [Rhodocyclaceae bacterium]|nr:CoA pyrophosphatase [Rhodocyclaceae bacterium]
MLRQRLAGPRQLQGIEEEGAPAGLTPAAVLVPVILRPEGLTVLFTQRTAHLNDHAGQVSFPGGRCETDDPSPVHTALRETEEEIGLDPARIEVLGLLPEYRTGTGFTVTPVVGLVRPPFELSLDSFEVAEVFETPLAFLLDPANHQRHSMEIGGVRRHYYAMPYEGYFIWGATAGMLVSLHRLLGGN